MKFMGVWVQTLEHCYGWLPSRSGQPSSKEAAITVYTLSETRFQAQGT